MKSSGFYHNVKGAVLAMSAPCFNDPNEKTGWESGMRSHLGTHHASIRRLLANEPDWRRLCSAVHSAIDRCNKDVLEILVFCKSGRHRSVALGACLQLALQTNPRVEGQPSRYHLSQELWPHIFQFCNACPQCTGLDAKLKI